MIRINLQTNKHLKINQSLGEIIQGAIYAHLERVSALKKKQEAIISAIIAIVSMTLFLLSKLF